jgi:hypothetical protein
MVITLNVCRSNIGRDVMRSLPFTGKPTLQLRGVRFRITVPLPFQTTVKKHDWMAMSLETKSLVVPLCILKG